MKKISPILKMVAESDRIENSTRNSFIFFQVMGIIKSFLDFLVSLLLVITLILVIIYLIKKIRNK